MITFILLVAALVVVGLFALRRFHDRRADTERWPRHTLPVAGFDFAGASFARYAKGGDYHDIFAPPDATSVAVVVGDVAGHDALAARLMRVAAGLLRKRIAAPGQLAGLMAGVNRELTPYMRAGRFMTLFMAVMVGATRSIHWVSAGHAPVIAYDPVADRFADVPGKDIPLGIDPDWHYHEMEHTGWPAGMLLIVGTDGIWEARNPNGEMYGRERLCQAVRDAQAGSAADIVEAVTTDLTAFRQGRPQGDDVTLVVVKAL
jgi:sigma-B regulation protein RsbU (phosphoserine phosphatase)